LEYERVLRDQEIKKMVKKIMRKMLRMGKKVVFEKIIEIIKTMSLNHRCSIDWNLRGDNDPKKKKKITSIWDIIILKKKMKIL